MSKSKIIIAAVVVAVGALATVPFLMKNRGNSYAEMGSGDSDTRLIGYYKKRPIYMSDLSPMEKQNLYEAQNQVYHTIESILSRKLMEEKIRDYMGSHNIKSKAEAEAKFLSENVKVSDGEVTSFLKKNASNPGLKGKSPKDQEMMVRSYLMRQATGDFFAQVASDAEEKGQFQVASAYIPAQPVIPVKVENSPIRGDVKAPVTIVEFSDFQCPYCERAEDLLKGVLEKYKGKVRLVYKHFPLSFHKHAMGASITAYCAGKQNKFWDMHDKLFENQSKLSDALYPKLAKELKLNMSKYQTCVKDPATKKAVEKDVSYGESIHVSGTPSFFINGRQTPPSRSEFENAIRRELHTDKHDTK